MTKSDFLEAQLQQALASTSQAPVVPSLNMTSLDLSFPIPDDLSPLQEGTRRLQGAVPAEDEPDLELDVGTWSFGPDVHGVPSKRSRPRRGLAFFSLRAEKV